MPDALASATAARIAASCSHARVPAAPAAEGYRYLDLGGDVPPFYLRRFELDGRSAAIALSAPLELTSGGPAERGAPGLARAAVSIGARSIPWATLPALELPDAADAALLSQVVEELGRLELVPADRCPLCRRS
jgi:hypothetical protein